MNVRAAILSDCDALLPKFIEGYLKAYGISCEGKDGG